MSESTESATTVGSETEATKRKRSGIVLTETGKKKLRKSIKQLAKALCEAIKKKPKLDHYTGNFLRELGAPKGHAVRNITRDHRLALLRAANEYALKNKRDPLKRAPYYEDGNVWL